MLSCSCSQAAKICLIRQLNTTGGMYFTEIFFCGDGASAAVDTATLKKLFHFRMLCIDEPESDHLKPNLAGKRIAAHAR